MVHPTVTTSTGGEPVGAETGSARVVGRVLRGDGQGSVRPYAASTSPIGW